MSQQIQYDVVSGDPSLGLTAGQVVLVNPDTGEITVMQGTQIVATAQPSSEDFQGLRTLAGALRAAKYPPRIGYAWARLVRRD